LPQNKRKTKGDKAKTLINLSLSLSSCTVKSLSFPSTLNLSSLSLSGAVVPCARVSWIPAPNAEPPPSLPHSSSPSSSPLPPHASTGIARFTSFSLSPFTLNYDPCKLVSVSEILLKKFTNFRRFWKHVQLPPIVGRVSIAAIALLWAGLGPFAPEAKPPSLHLS